MVVVTLSVVDGMNWMRLTLIKNILKKEETIKNKQNINNSTKNIKIPQRVWSQRIMLFEKSSSRGPWHKRTLLFLETQGLWLLSLTGAFLHFCNCLKYAWRPLKASHKHHKIAIKFIIIKRKVRASTLI